MSTLSSIQSSNSQISSTLPPGLVAVFVGATSGVGEGTVKQFAKSTTQPRVYLIGRSQEAGNRIIAECKDVNPNGEFIFIKADTSLIRNVDAICRDISSKEEFINLLFLSTGTSDLYSQTAEGLPLLSALAFYTRIRFIHNLLPLLRSASSSPSLRRVVTVLAGAREGPISTTDFPAHHLSMFTIRAHLSSLTTLSLISLARKAPTISFVHTDPGPVISGIGRERKGWGYWVLSLLARVLGPGRISREEAGERGLFLATSSRYPPAQVTTASSGVPVVEVARGVDGRVGCGVYSVDSGLESAGPAVEKLLAGFERDGTSAVLQRHLEEEFKRIELLELDDESG